MSLDAFIRSRLDRDIKDAINPSGMSVHDGKMHNTHVSHIQRLLQAHDEMAKQLSHVIKYAEWHRGAPDGEDAQRTHLAVRVADAADLSCEATRWAALEAAVAKGAP